MIFEASPQPDPVRSWLAFQAYVHREHNKLPWSPAQWLLDHGQAFERGPLPKGVRRGPVKQCYANSLKLALDGGGRFVYCEGMAINMIPVDHAWCFDRATGLIVDRTWKQGRHYIGVPIRTEYAMEKLAGGFAVVNDWEHDFPIMTGEVPGNVWKEPLAQ